MYRALAIGLLLFATQATAQSLQADSTLDELTQIYKVYVQGGPIELDENLELWVTSRITPSVDGGWRCFPKLEFRYSEPGPSFLEGRRYGPHVHAALPGRTTRPLGQGKVGEAGKFYVDISPPWLEDLLYSPGPARLQLSSHGLGSDPDTYPHDFRRVYTLPDSMPEVVLKVLHRSLYQRRLNKAAPCGFFEKNLQEAIRNFRSPDDPPGTLQPRE